MDNRREWLAPLTGVGFVILVIVSFAIGGEPPSASDPVDEIVEHYVDNGDSVMIGAVIGGLAAVLLIYFAAYLRKVFRAAEGEGGVLSATTLIGATVLAVGASFDATLSFALAETAEDIDPAAVQALQALWDNDFLPLAVGSVVLFFSAGLSIVLHGALPKWLGWIAILIAVVGLTPVGFFAFLVGALWILVVSVMLSMRARRPAVPAAPPADERAEPGV
jgi:hypothetical protein